MFLNAIIEKDENGYFAYVPSLQGCVSQGKTYEEALTNIKEASELYLESLDDDELFLLKNKISSIVPIEIALNATIANTK
ncbi:type II toxin-antitoxin system HicB family antitoxin [Campylobacter gastrosuis]|uniref:Type II toxin-antitoxin system HicB family antitoxin n=1 Tax=Campylobacter gastrosuis TaxID=2974576 RepID=A0ABT7HST2_9BACT|nr:type II toxin-antitoxin system HicB family antitoxin [Campylobacter gastrosuis]MDL0089984.1 type II toxin-antitoxin system HicB family antitoxin [Campylobacter gastrosuis]